MDEFVLTVENVLPGSKAFVDGKEIKNVKSVCPITGEVVALATDENGDAIFNPTKDDFEMVTHRGQVTLVFPAPRVLGHGV